MTRAWIFGRKPQKWAALIEKVQLNCISEFRKIIKFSRIHIRLFKNQVIQYLTELKNVFVGNVWVPICIQAISNKVV